MTMRRATGERMDPKDGSVLVRIHYFKPGGKRYTEDEDVVWSPDPADPSEWTPFCKVVRLKDMIAVCVDSPLGYAQLCHPQLSGVERVSGSEPVVQVFDTVRAGELLERVTCHFAATPSHRRAILRDAAQAFASHRAAHWSRAGSVAGSVEACPASLVRKEDAEKKDAPRFYCRLATGHEGGHQFPVPSEGGRFVATSEVEGKVRSFTAAGDDWSVSLHVTERHLVIEEERDRWQRLVRIAGSLADMARRVLIDGAEADEARRGGPGRSP